MKKNLKTLLLALFYIGFIHNAMAENKLNRKELNQIEIATQNTLNHIKTLANCIQHDNQVWDFPIPEYINEKTMMEVFSYLKNTEFGTCSQDAHVLLISSLKTAKLISKSGLSLDFNDMGISSNLFSSFSDYYKTINYKLFTDDDDDEKSD